MKFKYPITAPKNRCIVQINTGTKYIITKASNLEWLAEEINSTIGRYQRGGVSIDNLYLRFVEYCYNNDIKNASFTVLYESNGNGYDLLKKELDLLIEHYGKDGCLNSNNIPYIPKTIHAKKGSNWLKMNEYLNFMRLLKKYEY